MAIVKKYLAEVISFQQPIKDIYTVRLKSLGGAFKYSPGQFLHLALDQYDPSSGWPESRCFSIQSGSKEAFIKLTFAVKGEFTSKMAENLYEGCVVSIKLPYGDLFSQEHPKDNAIFISGGTGITPFLSLFTDDSFLKYTNPVLYAGFREHNHNLYTEDLARAQQVNHSFEVNYYYEDENGIIDISGILDKHGISKTYFISGPPAMIKRFKNYLTISNVSVNQIKTDDWE